MLTVNESVQIIDRYKHLLDGYDLQDIVATTIGKALSEKTGIQAKATHYSISYPSLTITRPFTINLDNAQKELEYILNSCGVSLKDAQCYGAADYLLDQLSYKGTPGRYWGTDLKAYHAVHLVHFCQEGAFGKDYSKDNAWLEAQGIDLNADRFDFNIGEVRVQGFKNGRLDISGLVKDQEERLIRILEVKDTLRRVNVQMGQEFPYENNHPKTTGV
tara:strand:+ start:328 stop:978 length:651 start_codon:yes stop_codon:yes gene_type:complete